MSERYLPLPEDEAIAITREMARAYVRMVSAYQSSMQLPPAEAADAARSAPRLPMEITTEDYKLVSFHQLGRVLEDDPDRAMAIWSEIKRLAAAELSSGMRASEAAGVNADPWTRAQFLLIRQGLIDDWKPSGDVELRLIDMLAQSFCQWQQWLEVLTMRAQCIADVRDDAKRKKDGYYVPPRVTEAEATEQAVMMVDRFNRVYLRTLRSLRDLRRYSGTVIVNNPAQVNLAHQQVNVSK